MKANDVFYDERNDRYITLISRNDAKVWDAQVEEMGDDGEYSTLSVGLFTEQELGHFERRRRMNRSSEWIVTCVSEARPNEEQEARFNTWEDAMAYYRRLIDSPKFPEVHIRKEG